MIPRYEKEEIKKIWSDESKTNLWQEVELAVLCMRVNFAGLAWELYRKIRDILKGVPIDLLWWKKREKEETHHDLDAFLDERKRHLPVEFQHYVHEDMTSYDTEESPFVIMLKESIKLVKQNLNGLELVIGNMAKKYRYTIMMGRTHGQEAQLQSFGKRCLTWLKALVVSKTNLYRVAENLSYSRLSGAIGNYGGLDPEIELGALNFLELKPFYGATQIMPRELYAPIAQALCQIVMTLDKIAIDIRLGARSGNPIYQEPFGKKQKGSSAMPHKKNTISTEQMEGMARMAKGYLSMIMDNIKTWEERAIEQSSVERVAWPDLFHVVIHSLQTMTRILKDLAVYPDNMMREIVNSRGCYASTEVKKFLAEKGASFGLSAEEAYRIVQLAAFNVFSPSEEDEWVRKNPPVSLEEADEIFSKFQKIPKGKIIPIKEIICYAHLRRSPELEATEEVIRWNGILSQIFQSGPNINEFNKIFSIPYLLRNENKLYQEILGVE
jgi:adenylosuccinate lyase